MSVPEVVMLGGLIGLSIIDMRTKKVPVGAVVLLGMAATVFRLAAGTAFVALATGILPGIAVLLLAVCTRESIGTGDGLVLCALGIFCGAKQVVAVFGMALLFSAVLAMILLVLKRVGRKTELPFLPCLCAGYWLCLVW